MGRIQCLCFPSFHFQRRFEDSEEGEAGGDTTDFSVAFMAPAALVSPSVSLDHSYSIAFTRVQQPADHASGKEHSGRSQEDTGTEVMPDVTSCVETVVTTSGTPVQEEVETDGFSYIREELRRQGIPSETTSYILKGWRDSTKSQYRLYFRKWIYFCQQQSYNPFSFHEKNVLKFLTGLFNDGLSTSGVGTAKAAIHTILGAAKGQKIDTSYFESLMMKGFFNTRPSLPRYATTWDVNLLLAFLRDMPPNELLSLKELNMKITSLFTVLLGQRVQTITFLDIDFMKVSFLGLEIVFNKLLKTSRDGHHLPKTILPRWSDQALCPVSLFEFYIQRTQHIRGQEKQLLITSVNPHHKASRDSVARWIRDALKAAGIDTDYYKAHSSRGAAVSKAYKSVPLNIVLDAAGWSNAQTFAKHYQKPIEEGSKFAKAILEMHA